MPYGKCRNCIYCRTDIGDTFDARMRDWEIRFSVHEEQAEALEDNEDFLYCCRRAPILTFKEQQIFASLKGKFLDYNKVIVDYPFVPLDVRKVACGDIGCGEFELDPNALLDEYEQQQ